MAVKKYEGNVIPMYVATADTAVGDVIAFETTSVGVAQTAGLTGELISVDTEGVYEFPANTAEAFVQGEVVKWDGTEALALGTITMGVIWEGKGAGIDAPILVKIG